MLRIALWVIGVVVGAAAGRFLIWPWLPALYAKYKAWIGRVTAP